MSLTVPSAPVSPASSPAASPTPEPPARVLLADDEPKVLTAFARLLQARGYQVEAVANGEHALRLAESGSFDVVVSDIQMPRMDGTTLLRRLREKDLDIPVVLLTGNPEVASAMKAVEYGAMRYVPKPVDGDELISVVQQAVGVRRLARVRREAASALGSPQLGDRAGLEVHFEQAVDRLWNAFQPVVACSTRSVWGYEALVRSDEPTLKTPNVLFDAAERLDRVHELGRRIRRNIAREIRSAPEGARILVNLHPRDLLDESLYDPGSPLAGFASRVILELTERAPLDDVPDLRGRVKTLRDLGYRIALDDLGAGYAGLTTFTRLEPDLVKLDLVFARGIETDYTKQRLVKSITSMCGELCVEVIAEGVETAEAKATLLSLGCDLLQGYFFQRPDRSFPKPKNL